VNEYDLLLERHVSPEHTLLNLQAAEVLCEAGYQVNLTPLEITMPDGGLFRPDLAIFDDQGVTHFVEVERAVVLIAGVLSELTIYKRKISIYSHFVVIYRITLHNQSLLKLIIRSFDLSCKSLEHKTWKAAPINSWSRCVTPSQRDGCWRSSGYPNPPGLRRAYFSFYIEPGAQRVAFPIS
jgi:hypothetical protein